MKNIKKIREMLQGFKFSLRLEGIKAVVNIPDMVIIKEHEQRSNLEF